jgi:hypothetical protein
MLLAEPVHGKPAPIPASDGKGGRITIGGNRGGDIAHGYRGPGPFFVNAIAIATALGLKKVIRRELIAASLLECAGFVVHDLSLRARIFVPESRLPADNAGNGGEKKYPD